MDDAVLAIAESRFGAGGGGVARFNFRGVGGSGGDFDGGDGELDDALAVARYLGAAHPVEALTWIGYSFGAAVAWRAAASHRGEPPQAAVVLIAPPMPGMAFPAVAGAAATVIAGSRDSFVDAGALGAWIAAQSGSTLIAVDGADHFFGGFQDQLANALDRAFGGSPSS